VAGRRPVTKQETDLLAAIDACAVWVREHAHRDVDCWDEFLEETISFANVVQRALDVSPLLPLVAPCYPLLPLVTPCYPLLPLVTPCYPLLPLVTPCCPLLPLPTVNCFHSPCMAAAPS
jgi:hypothetical protein